VFVEESRFLHLFRRENLGPHILGYLEGQILVRQAIVCHVRSHTTDDEYLIRRKEGIHHCNCKGFIFSKEVPKCCKHIKTSLAEQNITQKVAKLTEQQIVEKCLKTAGIYEMIKQTCNRAGAGHDAVNKHVARLAQALMPYFGGGGPVDETTVAKQQSFVEDEVRTIWFD